MLKVCINKNEKDGMTLRRQCAPSTVCSCKWPPWSPASTGPHYTLKYTLICTRRHYTSDPAKMYIDLYKSPLYTILVIKLKCTLICTRLCYIHCNKYLKEHLIFSYRHYYYQYIPNSISHKFDHHC